MAAKLSDSELARRVRERSQQRSLRYRERLSKAGRTQTLIWLPTELRAQLDAKATELNQNLSEVTTALLTAALKPAPAPAQSTPLPLFDDEQLGPMGERLARIVALHEQGLSGYAIAAQVGCSEPTVRRALKRMKEEATV